MVECLKCGHIFSHYNNIYGTRCTECGERIEPCNKPHFIENIEEGKEALRETMKNKLKKDRGG